MNDEEGKLEFAVPKLNAAAIKVDIAAVKTRL